MVTVKGGIISVGTHMPLKPDVEKKCREKLRELSDRYSPEVLKELEEISGGVKFFMNFPGQTG